MIRFEHASFCYADSTAGVEDVRLHVGKGECVVLTGPSGNGKTTLLRLANGLAPSYFAGTLRGSIRIDGKDRNGEPLWERGRIVGSVFQDPKSQFFSSEMPGEVAFACENYGLPQEDIVSRTDAAMLKFRLEGLRNRPLDALSSGEKQRTAVASVYALNPSVYVCDEPTANLDEPGIGELRGALQSLKREGKTLLIAEHRLSWLMGLADRFVYIRDGRIRWEKTPEQMEALTQRELERLELRTTRTSEPEALPTPSGKGAPLLSLDGLSCRRNGNLIWDGICLSVWPGQIVAITGPNGSGKTTLAKVVAGLERASEGEVALHGRKAAPGLRRRRCWYCSNDTSTQFFASSVAEEMLLGLPRTEAVLAEARDLLERFGLSGLKEEHPAILSGGQKQRLSIACALLSGRDVLLFDEPTSGLDGGNMRRIADALGRAASEGKTVLIVTHDEELIASCCDFRFKIGGRAEAAR